MADAPRTPSTRQTLPRRAKRPSISEAEEPPKEIRTPTTRKRTTSTSSATKKESTPKTTKTPRNKAAAANEAVVLEAKTPTTSSARTPRKRASPVAAIAESAAKTPRRRATTAAAAAAVLADETGETLPAKSAAKTPSKRATIAAEKKAAKTPRKTPQKRATTVGVTKLTDDVADEDDDAAPQALPKIDEAPSNANSIDIDASNMNTIVDIIVDVYADSVEIAKDATNGPPDHGASAAADHSGAEIVDAVAVKEVPTDDNEVDSADAVVSAEMNEIVQKTPQKSEVSPRRSSVEIDGTVNATEVCSAPIVESDRDDGESSMNEIVPETPQKFEVASHRSSVISPQGIDERADSSFVVDGAEVDEEQVAQKIGDEVVEDVAIAEKPDDDQRADLSFVVDRAEVNQEQVAPQNAEEAVEVVATAEKPDEPVPESNADVVHNVGTQTPTHDAIETITVDDDEDEILFSDDSIESAPVAAANHSSIDLTDNTLDDNPTVDAAPSQSRQPPQPEPPTPIQIIIIPDTPMPLSVTHSNQQPQQQQQLSPIASTSNDRPLDATFSPEPSSPPGAASTIRKPSQFVYATPRAVGALKAPLRGIRKRSISMDGSAMKATANKANKSVIFHSPSNQAVPIDAIDLQMSRHIEDNNKENGADVTLLGAARRKRSLSMHDADQRRRDACRTRLNTPRRAAADASGNSSAISMGSAKKTRMPDFSAIHQRNFDRMESIADYKQRKEAVRARVVKPVDRANKTALPVPTADNKAQLLATLQSTLVKPVTMVRTPSKKLPVAIPPKTSTPSRAAAQPSTSAAWKPLQLTALPSFGASTSAAHVKPAAASATGKAAALLAERQAKNRALMRGHTAKTAADVKERNTQILRGVRSNRRFELQMKFRNDSKDEARE